MAVLLKAPIPPNPSLQKLEQSKMKIISLKPSFFRSKKRRGGRSVSRSEAPSFGSTSSSSDDSSSTPRSVLPDKVTRRELEVVLRRLGGSAEEELLAMLAEAVGSASGRIALADLAALGGGATPPAGQELRETFAVFDADGDGRISAEELMGVFVALGDDGCTIDDCRRIVGEVGSVGEGFVGFDDFVRMMDGHRW